MRGYDIDVGPQSTLNIKILGLPREGRLVLKFIGRIRKGEVKLLEENCYGHSDLL